MNIPHVLTIAGSDSGGGAGIQADLKTMLALGCYGMSAITSVTCQNTVGVFGVQDMPPKFVADQVARVLEDIGADAVKIGMLSNAGIIEAVAGALALYPVPHIVLDPVMVAKSGDALLREDARAAMIEHMIPLATLVTPNLPEAESLTGVRIRSAAEHVEAAEVLLQMGAGAVLIKGGHAPGAVVTDSLYTRDGGCHEYQSPRIETQNTHGTGCTLSTAIACYLAKGAALPEAVGKARDYLQGAIRNAIPLGKGHGPLGHGWVMDARDLLD